MLELLIYGKQNGRRPQLVFSPTLTHRNVPSRTELPRIFQTQEKKASLFPTQLGLLLSLDSKMAPLPKHHVVCLEECHCAIPKFSFPYTYQGYHNTTSDEIVPRIKDATIVISTIVQVMPTHMEKAPHLNLLAIMATGMDWVDKEYCAKRGISVINSPQSNISGVSEHAMGLYFAARKKIVEMHIRTTTTDEWAREGSLTKRFLDGPPLTASQEVLGIVGYGALGKRIEMLARAIGFGDVIVSERKGATRLRDTRVAFGEVLKRVTVLVLTCPRDPSTINMIGETELKSMRKEALLINVARGGIVDETALAKALKERWISSAATDVLEVEPGIKGSPLLPEDGEPIPNLTISPHIAWFAQETITTLQRLLKEGIDGWAAGKPVNVHVHEGRILK
jgi:phosphoglycerate dehydrogenase-like enzyme